MRLYDVIIMLIVLNATIVFIGGLNTDYGIFGGQDPVVISQISRAHAGWNITDLNESIARDEALLGKGSVIWSTLETLVEGAKIILRIIKSVIYIYPVLVDIFYIPEGLSGLIQLVIWVIYGWGFAQLILNRSTQHMT